jgi:hypothetical protein
MFSSTKVYIKLVQRKSSFHVEYQNSQFKPEKIVIEIENFLSEKPITVSHNNFNIFQLLGNQYFEAFFGHQALKSGTNFFLSFYSLKPLFSDFFETTQFSF